MLMQKLALLLPALTLHPNSGCPLLKLRMKARAEAVKAPKAVLTFEPHPRSYFDKEAAPKKLTSLAEKLRLFREEGVDIVYILRFNQALAELPAEHFIHQVLAQQLAIRDVTTGDAFVFGKGRLGTAKLIKAGAEYSGKYTANTVPARMQAGSPVSSSRIRALLAVGKVEEVAALLGRDYTLRGPVIAGDKRARGLGYPTANIALAPFRAVPAYGVYAVDVQRPGSEVWERGIANLGVRPTFGGGRALLEVHLLGQSLNLYGQRLTVRFLHRLREEKKFENMAQLAAQIARDAAASARPPNCIQPKARGDGGVMAATLPRRPAVGKPKAAAFHPDYDTNLQQGPAMKKARQSGPFPRYQPMRAKITAGCRR